MTYKGLVEPCGYWRRNNAEIENKTKTKRKSENKARKGWKIEEKTGKPIEARTKRKQWVQTERKEKRSYNPELRRSVSFVEKKSFFVLFVEFLCVLATFQCFLSCQPIDPYIVRRSYEKRLPMKSSLFVMSLSLASTKLIEHRELLLGSGPEGDDVL